MKRAIGAYVLVCLAMITAAPVAAITLGGECEKQCCRRQGNAQGREGGSHACCKRGKASSAMTIAAAEPRCNAGNANIGLARFQAATAVTSVPVTHVRMADAGVMSRIDAVRGETVLRGHALFQRPPPAS